jgi:phosphoglycolate phosphatase
MTHWHVMPHPHPDADHTIKPCLAADNAALVVFDLDGTLIDSRKDLADSANELLAAYGAPPLEEEAVGRMVGEGAAVLVARILAARSLDVPRADALVRYLDIYDRRLLDHTRPYDGIPEALAALGARARLATLTNKPVKATNQILDALGLRSSFEWVIGGDSSFGRKPAPDGLLWMMRQAGAPANRTVLVGDSVTDLLTARAARSDVCIARYGFGYPNMPEGSLTGTELVVDAPSELAAVIGERLRNGSS